MSLPPSHCPSSPEGVRCLLPYCFCVHFCVSTETFFSVFIGVWCQSYWHVKRVSSYLWFCICFCLVVTVHHKTGEKLMAHVSSLPVSISPSCLMCYRSYCQAHILPCMLQLNHTKWKVRLRYFSVASGLHKRIKTFSHSPAPIKRHLSFVRTHKLGSFVSPIAKFSLLFLSF